jgi:tetratricopeptide (TPR) repeat protein
MPTLGLSMIVKNAAQTLPACLESVRGVVDEIVIADTGSTDDTQEIARRHGAVVVSVPWENSFAKARNAALALNTTDWILVLDADEELDASAASILPELLKQDAVGGYAVTLRNYLLTRHGRIGNSQAKPNDSGLERAKDAASYAEFLGVRLFRRHPEVFYTGCVHERVTPQLAKLGMEVQTAGICVHHFGFLLMGSESFAQKIKFYESLVRAKVQDHPEDPIAWFDLGSHISAYSEQCEEALGCFERALAIEPRLSAAWLQKGILYLKLGRDLEALSALERAAGDAEADAEREHRLGDALHNLGRLDEARCAYRRCLGRTGNYPDVESKLGYTEVRLGSIQTGLKRLCDAVAACPHNAEMRERLVKAYVVADMLSKAADAAEDLAMMMPTPRRFLRAAAIRAHLKQTAGAERLENEGLRIFPDSDELKKSWGLHA